MKRMKYSLWKQYYRQFPADQYDQATKTILVDVPDARKQPFPKAWRRDGNHYWTPGGCEVTFWGTGFAENFEVRRSVSYYEQYSRTIHPGIDSRERVIQAVYDLEGISPT